MSLMEFRSKIPMTRLTDKNRDFLPKIIIKDKPK